MLRTSSFYRWSAAALAGAAMLLVTVACTASSPTRPPSDSAAPSHTTSGSSTPPSDRTVRLSCADAGSGNTPTGNDGLAIGGITLEGLAGNVAGSPTTDLGVSVPTGDTLYFFKAPAWLEAGAAATIELQPTARGYLAWVPARIWTSGAGGVDLTQWMASKLVLDGCPDRDVTYFGGLLSTDPHICLKLHVADATGKSRQISVGSATHC
jgi:hypothetical protein